MSCSRPAEEREAKFHVGSRTFDPRVVGYRNEQLPWSYEFDTSQVGNHNTGHQFGSGGPGTIGPLLTHEQRLELIEYVKVLGNPAFADLDEPAMAAEDPGLDRRDLLGLEGTAAYASGHRTVEPFVGSRTVALQRGPAGRAFGALWRRAMKRWATALAGKAR